jgi:hypothetical protein
LQFICIYGSLNWYAIDNDLYWIQKTENAIFLLVQSLCRKSYPQSEKLELSLAVLSSTMLTL